MKQHLIDFGKGVAAAVLVAAGTAFLNYLGAHLPDLLSFIGMALAGTAGVKAK